MTFTYVTDSKHRFYLDKILTQAGITDVNTKTQINVILSCWSFVVACGGSYLLDFVGRRKQALGSVMGMIVSLYAVGGMIKSEFQKFRSSLFLLMKLTSRSFRRQLQQIRRIWHDRLHLPVPRLLCILNHSIDKPLSN